jgi:hypothetical protein
VYLGGINGSDTLLYNATFHTLPADGTGLRVVMCHKGRIDHVSPAEVDLWGVLENKLSMKNATTADVHGKSSGMRSRSAAAEGPGHGHGHGDSTLGLGLSSNSKGSKGHRETPSASAGSDEPDSPVHLIIHNGDFISVDSILRGRAAALIDLLLRPDTSVASWRRELKDTEALLADHYRKSLRDPTVRNILRSCGNVFVAGAGEAGSATAATLVLSVASRSDDGAGDGTGTADASASTAESIKDGIFGDEISKRLRSRAAARSEAEKMRDELQLLLMAALVRTARYRTC